MTDGNREQPATTLTFAEVAKLAGVSVHVLAKERANRRGPRAFKIGRRLFVMREDADAWLCHRRAQGRT
ncbi:MAG TPA: DNA-binding protein [Casimicrobiaceae bacterium]